MIYGVHESTACRWLAKVQKLVLSRTRRLLLSRFKVGRPEYDSIMRVVASHLEVTLTSFLGEES